MGVRVVRLHLVGLRYGEPLGASVKIGADIGKRNGISPAELKDGGGAGDIRADGSPRICGKGPEERCPSDRAEPQPVGRGAGTFGRTSQGLHGRYGGV